MNHSATDNSDGRLFFVVVALILTMRIGVLLGSQRWLQWDECIIGLAAKDVLRGNNVYYYFPGQPYGGGAFFETLAIAGLYLPFGVSALAVKLYALLVSMATVLVIGLFVRRVWGWSAANWSCLLWATAPGLAIFSLQVRSGYIEIQLLAAAALYLFYLSGFGPGARPRHFVALGLLGGLAYYNFALAMPLLLAMAAIGFAWDKWFWMRRRSRLTMVGALIGLAPMIYYDVTHHFGHVRWLWLSKGRAADVDLLDRVRRAVSFELPSFFQAHVDDFFPSLHWSSEVLGALTGALAILWLWQARSDLATTGRQLVRGMSRAAPWPAGLQATMVVFVAVFLILYPFGPTSGLTPRYFVGLYPVLSIGMGVGIAEGFRRGRRRSKFILGLVGGSLVLGGALVNVHLMNLAGLRKVLGSATLREGKIEVRPGGIIAVRDWLLEHDIRNVYAHPIIKWKLMFYSDEAILASAIYSTFPDDWDKLPFYGRAVRIRVVQDHEAYAFVLHRDLAYQGGLDGEYWRFLVSTLRSSGVSWKEHLVGDYRILYDIEGPAAQVLESMLIRRNLRGR